MNASVRTVANFAHQLLLGEQRSTIANVRVVAGAAMVGISRVRAPGATLAALRRATAADHRSVDALIDRFRMGETDYYAAVVRGLMASAEVVESALPRIPRELHREGLLPANVSKRVAMDAESSFLGRLVGPPPVRRRRLGGGGGYERLLVPDPVERATALGLLYVYVGSALGGWHLLRVARTASWWDHEREQVFLQPYGHHLPVRWRAVLNAVERLDVAETDAAVMTARASFDAVRQSLLDHLSVGGD